MKRLLLGAVLAAFAAAAAGCGGSSSSASGPPIDTNKNKGPITGGEGGPPPIPKPPK